MKHYFKLLFDGNRKITTSQCQSGPGSNEKERMTLYIPNIYDPILVSNTVYIYIYIYIDVGWLVYWVLWHINLCRLFHDKSIFMSSVLFKTIQFSISTLFNGQKHLFQIIQAVICNNSVRCKYSFNVEKQFYFK